MEMKKRIRKQLSMILIVAMVFSSSVGVYADEVRDDPGVSENTPAMPGAGAGAEIPGASGQQAEMPDEGTTLSDNATAPELPDEPVSENLPGQTVSEDEILPDEEEGIYEPEEQAGDNISVSDDSTLRAAIASAAAGTTIALDSDISLDGVLYIGDGKEITIDLNGHTLTGRGTKIDELVTAINYDGAESHEHEVENRFLISVSGNTAKVKLTDSKKTGSLTYDKANFTRSDSIVAVWKGAKLTLENISITASDNKLLIPKRSNGKPESAMRVGGKAVMVVGNTGYAGNAAEYENKSPVVGSTVFVNEGTTIEKSYIGIYAIGKGAAVSMNGGTINAVNAAIQNQGQLSYFGTDITVNGGTLNGNGKQADAIYHPGAGKLTINGGTFKGAAGIEISNGDVVINAGDISSSADFETGVNLDKVANGSTVVGCGICYSPYTNSGVKSSLTIKGGNVSGAYGLFVNYRGGNEAYYSTNIRLNIKGGIFDSLKQGGKAMGVSDNVPLGANIHNIISFTGGSFNTRPDREYISGGYYAKKAAGGRFDVVPVNEAYLYPKLTAAHVLNGQTIGEILQTVLRDAYAKEYEGTTVSGAAYVSTNEAGENKGTVSEGKVLKAGETWYLAAIKGAGSLTVSRNGEEGDVSGEYSIKNQVSLNQILKFTVEDISGDSIRIYQKRPVRYSEKITDAFEYFDFYYTHNGEESPLPKTSKVDIRWGKSDTAITDPAYDFEKEDASTVIWMSASYLGVKAVCSFQIERLPIYVKATKEVSSLVGDELTERYYGLIDVYSADETGRMSDKKVVSGDKVRIEEWFDSTSSVIDLTGISNIRKHDGYKAVLKDLGKLKSDDEDDREKNYELAEKPWVVYNVRPSVIFDFRDATETDEIAPAKIRRSDDTTPMTIYSFTNGQLTTDAKWCVKTVRFDSIESCWIEEMKEISTIGIKSDPTADGKGTKFSFGQEFLENYRDDGGRFTLYEIFSEDVTASDNNMSLTVKALQPVIFNGNKFVAKDDTRYYSRGIIKSGYSPSLDVRVYDGTKKLSFGSDYTLTYKYNKNAGNKDSENRPTVIVTGKGDYSEMKITAYFVILPADLEYASDVSVTTQYIKYSGKVLKPKVKAVYAYGANAGKTIPASAYDITVFDEDGRDVTVKKFNTSARAGKYTVVLTANGSNPNISGSTSDPAKDGEMDAAGSGSGIYFYGIPKASKKMTVGGTLSKVAYPLTESEGGIDSFLDKDKFYAKTAEKKYNYQDIDRDDREGSISVDLVSGKDECTAVVYDEKDITGETLNSGVYYLKVQYATAALKQKYYVFEPTYVKVTYAGTKLKADDIKLKKKSFDFSSGDEYTDLELKLSKRIDNRGTDGIKLYVFQNGTELDLSDLREENYVIKGDALSNNRAGRYRIRVEGTGSYYGAYDLTYTVGVQPYNKDKTPAAVLVNTADPKSPEDETERPVHYRPDGQYDNSMVKVVWTKANGEKEVLQQRGASGNEAGDYYVVWSTFKQVGPKKGTVTIVGTGTRFTGKIKKKFDVDQAE